jgi:hypothetical protein
MLKMEQRIAHLERELDTAGAYKRAATAAQRREDSAKAELKRQQADFSASPILLSVRFSSAAALQFQCIFISISLSTDAVAPCRLNTM